MDLNNGVGSGIWALYHEPKTLKIDQSYNVFVTRPTLDGYLGCDKEQLRQTILQHETLFRYQLEELHRLYKRQRDLVNDVKKRELQHHLIEAQISPSNLFVSHIHCGDVEKTSDLPLRDPTFGRSSTSRVNSFQSPLSFMRGKNMLGPFPSQDRVGSKDNESRESKSNMLQRTLLNLEVPASLCMNEEGEKQGEQGSFPFSRSCEGTSERNVSLSIGSWLSPATNGDAFRPNSCTKSYGYMVDLNEPTQVEEASGSASADDFDNVTCLDEEIRRWDVSVNSKSGFRFFSQESSESSLLRGDRGIRIKDMHSDNKGNRFTCMNQAGHCRCDEDSFCSGVCSEDSPALFHSQQVEPSKEHRGRRTIFGVEISEGNHGQSVEVSHTPSLHPVSPQFHVAKSEPSISPQANASNIFSPNVLSVCGNASVITSFPAHINYHSSLERHELQNKENTGSVDGQREHENPTGGVSRLREKELAKVEPIKRREDSQLMNSHSLLNHLHGFAQKSEELMDLPQNLIQDSQSAMSACGSVASYGDGGNDGKVKDLVKEEAVGTYICGLRQQIDLNLCINEDEAPPIPSLPRAIVRIATTEIDLESPAVFESEVSLSPQQDSSVNQLNSPSRLPLGEAEEKDEERARVAAEAIIAISSSDPMEHIACHPLPVLSNDCLHWFAEVVSSCQGDFEGELNDEDSIPDGMDYFEFMTMNLIETKAEEYSSKSLDSEDQKYEQTEPTSSSKQPRRGLPRKGRQRKDFQRDILPGLIPLSRHEVTEDFMSFEELFKAGGFSWNPSQSRRNTPKKGNRRQRLRHSAPSVTPTAVSEPPVEKPICRELVFGERMLTGWGKRTRRFPRQRCTTDNPPPPPPPPHALKC